jgi:hypothetical protein
MQIFKKHSNENKIYPKLSEFCYKKYMEHANLVQKEMKDSGRDDGTIQHNMRGLYNTVQNNQYGGDVRDAINVALG